MSKNLVKYPNTKNYYITEDGEVVKIVTGNFESDRNRYVFTEDKCGKPTPLGVGWIAV